MSGGSTAVTTLSTRAQFKCRFTGNPDLSAGYSLRKYRKIGPEATLIQRAHVTSTDETHPAKTYHARSTNSSNRYQKND